jgi:hypothetical protein
MWIDNITVRSLIFCHAGLTIQTLILWWFLGMCTAFVLWWWAVTNLYKKKSNWWLFSILFYDQYQALGITNLMVPALWIFLLKVMVMRWIQIKSFEKGRQPQQPLRIKWSAGGVYSCLFLTAASFFLVASVSRIFQITFPFSSQWNYDHQECYPLTCMKIFNILWYLVASLSNLFSSRRLGACSNVLLSSWFPLPLVCAKQ